MDNILELKTINELQIMNFLIPSYQRGFRWSEKEVTELLNDISEFTPKQIGDTDKKTWYCLQPIVVKVKTDEEIGTQRYEVIDGQQRLTTIYLILYYLNQLYTEENREPLFTLNYETRPESHSFLEKLEKGNINNSNIDFYYISIIFLWPMRLYVIGLRRTILIEMNFNQNSGLIQKLYGMKAMKMTPLQYLHVLISGKYP